MNSRKAASIGINIFFWVFRIMAILTPIYLIFCVSVLYWDKMRGNSGQWDRYSPEAVILIFSSLRFFIWQKIFFFLREAFEKNNSKSFVNTGIIISKLLYATFVVDLTQSIYKILIRYSSNLDWNRIQWPDISSPFPNFLIESLLFFFKVTVLGSGFLTPTIFGTSALMLGLIVNSIVVSADR